MCHTIQSSSNYRHLEKASNVLIFKYFLAQIWFTGVIDYMNIKIRKVELRRITRTYSEGNSINKFELWSLGVSGPRTANSDALCKMLIT